MRCSKNPKLTPIRLKLLSIATHLQLPSRVVGESRTFRYPRRCLPRASVFRIADEVFVSRIPVLI